MSENLIPIKSFLGKYHSELLYSATSLLKYKDTKLDTFFEQRYYIQNNKVQMIIDPAATGLTVHVSGNEIHVSKELYDHPNVVINNSLESNQSLNPRNLYNPEIFSTIAYLICQNHTTFQIIGEIDEPIYVKYNSDYETFYSSVIVFDISNEIEVEIVEEFESFSALNAVTNYVLYPNSRLNLSTFYQNHLSALSFCYRNVIVQDNAKFNHILLGKGSSNVVDENKIYTSSGSKTEMLGIVDSDGKNFHSILFVEPAAPDYKISVNYKDILLGKSSVTFFPSIVGQIPSTDVATVQVLNMTIDGVAPENREAEIKRFISDIVDMATLERMIGVKRFYDNKSRFLHFP